jgi:hypothetical protein
MSNFKKSEFTELQDLEKASAPSPVPVATETIDEIPPSEKFSWNPIDWYIGIRRELQEINFQMTERKRVVVLIELAL